MSPPTSTIFLARHGQVEQVSPRRFIGQRDVPLDKTGRSQAEALALVLADMTLDGIWSSDLSRAVDTAKPTAAGRGIKTVPELREIRLGDWEGLTSDEVRARFPGEYEKRGADFSEFRPTGGESFRDLQERALPALERIAGSPGRHLVVAHGGLNRALLCAILGMPLAHLMRMEQDYCHVNILLRDASGWRIQGLNLPPSVLLS